MRTPAEQLRVLSARWRQVRRELDAAIMLLDAVIALHPNLPRGVMIVEAARHLAAELTLQMEHLAGELDQVTWPAT